MLGLISKKISKKVRVSLVQVYVDSRGGLLESASCLDAAVVDCGGCVVVFGAHNPR